VTAAASTGVPDLRLHRFPSRQLRNTRTVRVLLPPGYDDPENRRRRYPVLFLNDGQNLFERLGDFPPDHWAVSETVTRLVRDGEIRPLVVVGIDHAERRRNREFTPYPDPLIGIRRPAGARYPAFLLNELLPWIEGRYRVLRGPQLRGLGGSSLGAAAALYATIARPGSFGRLLLESPSLFIAGQQLLRDSLQVRRWPRKVVLAVGTHETNREAANAATVGRVQALAGILRAAGLGPDRLRLTIDEGGRHGESDWARRLPYALRFLYGTGHASAGREHPEKHHNRRHGESARL
jgi:predicted alpha/beta superfamily hydrolase